MKEKDTSKIINSYAEALYDAASKQNECEQIFAQSQFLSKELNSDKKNAQRLNNPLWSNGDKLKVMTEYATKHSFNVSLTNFIKTIIDNGRIGLLSQIMKKFSDIYYKKQNIAQVSVQTVLKLSDEQQKRLEQSLEKYLAKKVVVNYKINPEILGGLLIECDSKLIDDSIKGKLDRIKMLMKGAK